MCGDEESVTFSQINTRNKHNINIHSIKHGFTGWCQILDPAQGLHDRFWQHNNKEE